MPKLKTKAIEFWWRVKDTCDVFYHTKIAHKIRLRSIRRKGKATVVFFASTLSMWKFDELYSLFANDTRFNVKIILIPFRSYSEEQKRCDMDVLKEYFDKRDIPYLEGEDANQFIRRSNPDILFYPQPYYGLYEVPFAYYKHKSRLLCYIPYALFTATGWWAYNLNFHNVAWKLYYPTDMHKEDAIKQAYNRGCNVVTVGDLDYFSLYKPTGNKDVWRAQECKKRRIIWAPHHSIAGGEMNRDSFTWMANFMITIAERYSDKIQFAFKPHPRLKTELYAHHNWGPELTEAYYNKWETMSNTQVELGEYVDLFNSSDALIHDCGSFTALYQYTNKPALFVSTNIDSVKSELNDFGLQCLERHYHAKNEAEIISFIEEIVLNNQHSAKETENEIISALTPPHGVSAAHNIYNDIVKTLGI